MTMNKIPPKPEKGGKNSECPSMICLTPKPSNILVLDRFKLSISCSHHYSSVSYRKITHRLLQTKERKDADSSF